MGRDERCVCEVLVMERHRIAEGHNAAPIFDRRRKNRRGGGYGLALLWNNENVTILECAHWELQRLPPVLSKEMIIHVVAARNAQGRALKLLDG